MHSLRPLGNSGNLRRSGSSMQRKFSIYKRLANLFDREKDETEDGFACKKKGERGGGYARSANLTKLCEEVPSFTRKEIKWMYKEFKQECPSGEMTQEHFVDVYSRFFSPNVNCQRYARHLFRALVFGESLRCLTFEAYIRMLDKIDRQSMVEKLKFMFCIYDVNNDGSITKDEVKNVVQSVYELAGWDTSLISEYIGQHVDEVFAKMDHNGDGKISEDEFIQTLLDDGNIIQNIEALKTVQ
ncbi:KCNIP3 (predicted) [Pycnogonum litorale]